MHLTVWILTLLLQLAMSFSALYQLVLCVSGVWMIWRTRRAPDTLRKPSSHDQITVLVPARNEAAVLRHTITAIQASDYPLAAILIIDDVSSDATGDIADHLAREDARVHVIHRTSRSQGDGKGAALMAALPLVETPLVAVFDADNAPEPQSISRLVEALAARPDADAAVGQFRCRNHAHNLLTRLIDVEGILFQAGAQAGRFALFGEAALTGTNYVIHTRCLRDLGGWDPTALTEDCDLTVRMRLKGKRLLFVPAAISWEQAPQTATHWRRQRLRWARGNLHVLQRLLRSSYPTRQCWRRFDWIFVLSMPYLLLSLFVLMHLQLVLSCWLPVQGWWTEWLWPMLFGLLMVQIQAVLLVSRAWTLSRALAGVLLVLWYGYARSTILLETLCAEYVCHRSVQWIKTPRYRASTGTAPLTDHTGSRGNCSRG